MHYLVNERYTCIKMQYIIHLIEHEGNVENMSGRQVFSTFLECSQMTGVFYHSVIHGLGFFISFMI